jgi:hypothetical protein
LAACSFFHVTRFSLHLVCKAFTFRVSSAILASCKAYKAQNILDRQFGVAKGCRICLLPGCFLSLYPLLLLPLSLFLFFTSSSLLFFPGFSLGLFSFQLLSLCFAQFGRHFLQQRALPPNNAHLFASTVVSIAPVSRMRVCGIR